ncbi:hypothetical protein DB345_12290 [Spartobacteria bacterium LR76]|nr:hypothetical protein DB345_12290 [Spartobacteria bacterium LR76]
MTLKRLKCDKDSLFDLWLVRVRGKGYQVVPLVGEELSKDLIFDDRSFGWMISNGKANVGVTCKEIGDSIEVAIHVSTPFIWFGGNLNLASDIEALLLEAGGRSERMAQP